MVLRFWTRDFLVNGLGFVVGTEVGSGPAFVTLDRDGQTVMPNCRLSFGLRKSWWAVYFWTNDIEALFGDITSRGTKTKHDLVSKEYGCREFVVVTAPDGRELVVGEALSD